jgi:Flp pilus assembly protein TadB
MDEAIRANDSKRAEELKARVDRYESEPTTGEGKKELMLKAHQIEAERDLAKKQSPWIGYASTAYQLSIVLLSASILAVNIALFWASFGVAGAGIVLMSQGLWLWM